MDFSVVVSEDPRKSQKIFFFENQRSLKESTLRFDWIKASRNWTNPKKGEKKLLKEGMEKKTRKMRKSDEEVMRAKQERWLSIELKKHPQ